MAEWMYIDQKLGYSYCCEIVEYLECLLVKEYIIPIIMVAFVISASRNPRYSRTLKRLK